MTKKIQRYLTEAKKQSVQSNYVHKVGCIIVAGNVIISKAYNEIRHCKIGNTKYAKFKESVHAERNAARRVDKDKLIGSTVYIYRETKDGKSALAYPCESCLMLLISKRINKIVYSTSIYPYYGVVNVREKIREVDCSRIRSQKQKRKILELFM